MRHKFKGNTILCPVCFLYLLNGIKSPRTKTKAASVDGATRGRGIDTELEAVERQTLWNEQGWRSYEQQSNYQILEENQ